MAAVANHDQQGFEGATVYVSGLEERLGQTHFDLKPIFLVTR